jgi:hypothetical protein
MYVEFGWKFHAVVKIPRSKVNRWCDVPVLLLIYSPTDTVLL